LPSSDSRQSSTAAITHIAANDVTIGERRLRQRCAWCGAILLDYDFANMAVAGDEWSPPGTWPVGRLVRVDGSYSALLDEAEELPDDACGRVDDEVTR
jgi:hypothetical protein